MKFFIPCVDALPLLEYSFARTASNFHTSSLHPFNMSIIRIPCPSTAGALGTGFQGIRVLKGNSLSYVTSGIAPVDCWLEQVQLQEVPRERHCINLVLHVYHLHNAH